MIDEIKTRPEKGFITALCMWRSVGIQFNGEINRLVMLISKMVIFDEKSYYPYPSFKDHV